MGFRTTDLFGMTGVPSAAPLPPRAGGVPVVVEHRYRLTGDDWRSLMDYVLHQIGDELRRQRVLAWAMTHVTVVAPSMPHDTLKTVKRVLPEARREAEDMMLLLGIDEFDA